MTGGTANRPRELLVDRFMAVNADFAEELIEINRAL
jgi:hypothetical protein